MKTGIVVAAALARIACAQDFDFGAVLNAPPPSLTAPPLDGSSASATPVNTAAVGASISAQVKPTTASITGAAATAAATQQPSELDKRGLWDLLNWWLPKTTSTSTQKKTTATPSATSAKNTAEPAKTTAESVKTTATPSPSTTSTSTLKQSSTTTDTSSSACPTTPEEGTYCGFINPEDPCAPQPDGYGPKVQPDTPEAFESYGPFHQEAQNAKTPPGYELVFSDLNASVSGNSYITFYTLKSYDTSECATKCDETDLCTAFNLYIERDPSLNPTTNPSDPANNCPNPSSITNYKCSLWGSSIEASAATNEGGHRGDFEVVIVASNGYDKTNSTTPEAPPGYSQPTKCPGGAISKGGAYHVGSHFYPGAFNPGLCGVYADAQTEKNREDAKAKGLKSFTPCNMFNAYMVHKNGIAQGTYCSLYDTVLGSQWADYSGAWSGSNWFGFESSWTYSKSKLDSGEL